MAGVPLRRAGASPGPRSEECAFDLISFSSLRDPDSLR